MPVLTREESDAYERQRRAEMERSRNDLGIIGQQKHNGAMINIVGPCTRGPYSGTGVKRPKRMIERHFPRCVQHLLHMYPMTKFEIRLEDIGALVRQWVVIDACLTCEGLGTIQKEMPNHLWYWAREVGAKCRRCNGHGRIVHPYEERITLPKSFVRRSALLFKDADDVVHLVTKKGKRRATRCRAFKEIDEMFLSGYGVASCVLCLAWVP